MEILRQFMSQIDGSLSSKLAPKSPNSMTMDFGKVQVMTFRWHFLWWDFYRIWFHFGSNCPQNDM